MHRRGFVTNTIDSPAAGADFAFSISTGDRAWLLALTAKLTTSATVASRVPGLALEDQNGLVFWQASAVDSQAASLAAFYSWARGGPTVTPASIIANSRVSNALPWLELQPGDQVKSITSLIDTADTWTSITYRAAVGDYWAEEEQLARLAADIAAGRV